MIASRSLPANYDQITTMPRPDYDPVTTRLRPGYDRIRTGTRPRKAGRNRARVVVKKSRGRCSENKRYCPMSIKFAPSHVTTRSRDRCSRSCDCSDAVGIEGEEIDRMEESSFEGFIGDV